MPAADFFVERGSAAFRALVAKRFALSDIKNLGKLAKRNLRSYCATCCV